MKTGRLIGVAVSRLVRLDYYSAQEAASAV